MNYLLSKLFQEVRQVMCISSLLLLCVLVLGVCYATYSGMLSRLVRNGRENHIKTTKITANTLQQQLKVISNRQKLLQEKQDNLLKIKREKSRQLEKQRKIMKDHQGRMLRMEEMAQDLHNIDRLLTNVDKKSNKPKDLGN